MISRRGIRGFESVFTRPAVIGMVHLGALPGSPRFDGDLDAVISRAVSDAKALESGGADGVMVENFFDSPFVKQASPPVTIAAITRAVLAVREAVSLPIGVNVLRNDVCAAISIAHVCGAQFVRCNVFVGAVVADQGVIEGAAREAMEVRSRLRADVQIWADVAVKHAAVLGDYPLGRQAQDAWERGLADAIIVTGEATGAPTPLDRVSFVAEAVPGCPVLIGSGVTASTAPAFAGLASGIIAGSSLKSGGSIEGPVEIDRVRAVVRALRSG